VGGRIIRGGGVKGGGCEVEVVLLVLSFLLLYFSLAWIAIYY